MRAAARREIAEHKKHAAAAREGGHHDRWLLGLPGPPA
jgi:hypothetical protein